MRLTKMPSISHVLAGRTFAVDHYRRFCPPTCTPGTCVADHMRTNILEMGGTLCAIEDASHIVVHRVMWYIPTLADNIRSWRARGAVVLDVAWLLACRETVWYLGAEDRWGSHALKAVESRVEYMDMDDIRFDMERLPHPAPATLRAHADEADRYALQFPVDLPGDIRMELSSDSEPDDEPQPPRPRPVPRKRYALQVVIPTRNSRTRPAQEPRRPRTIASLTPHTSPTRLAPPHIAARPLCPPAPSPSPCPPPPASRQSRPGNSSSLLPRLKEGYRSTIPFVQLPPTPVSQRGLRLIDPRLRTANFFSRVPIPADVFYDKSHKAPGQADHPPYSLASLRDPLPAVHRMDVTRTRQETVTPETPHASSSRYRPSTSHSVASSLPSLDVPYFERSQADLGRMEFDTFPLSDVGGKVSSTEVLAGQGGKRKGRNRRKSAARPAQQYALSIATSASTRDAAVQAPGQTLYTPSSDMDMVSTAPNAAHRVAKSGAQAMVSNGKPVSSHKLFALDKHQLRRRAFERQLLKASLRYETQLRSLLRRQKTRRKLVPFGLSKSFRSRARSRTQSRARSLARDLAKSRAAQRTDRLRSLSARPPIKI